MGHAVRVLKKKAPRGAVNAEGYSAYERDWREEYLKMLLTNLISDIFYASEKELGEESLGLHHFAADEDPEFMAKALLYARTEGYMRLQPIIGAAVLSLASPTWFARIFDRVIVTVADLVEFTLALESLGRGQGGRVVKKFAAARLERLTEYEVLKYSGSGRGYSLKDLLRVYHPKPRNIAAQALYRYVARKKGYRSPDPHFLPRITALERLKKIDLEYYSDEGSKLIRSGGLPWNAVTGAISKMTPELWAALLPDMTLFSLLRHLNVMIRNGVISEHEFMPEIAERFTDPEAIRRAKILPFRFASAWNEVGVPWVKEVLERAVDLSAETLPEIPGRTAVLLDISSSMSGRPLLAASVLALSILKRAGGNGMIRLFNHEDCLFQTRRGESIPTAASRIKASGGTDTGVSIRAMEAEKAWCDQLVIVTDEQQNTGPGFCLDLKRYRRRVNPEARAFIINMAPCAHGMTPVEDENTFYCYGWSDHAISFIAHTLQGYGGLIERVLALG